MKKKSEAGNWQQQGAGRMKPERGKS